ncbi:MULTISPECIES: hypothetical protein [unclassified Bradyrhizobium]|uniref:hypothetical protein n=1 Tax=unclassified Bradyrhizobium TaxID=2631580 RepID=UPI00247AC053|nr:MULTISPECIES: hypothetical protein [unclassified Bradyrhizobium]WGR73082.1 hypothetical protein MTX24_09720 [Bradyrhizobium sp. ISRA426]WGR77921.1 hypothetical protein MTX21_34690 [Bradyrhizobium sp. ISRA430]WGR88323.1 hypothetical protein MTX25_09730 [Bradyrhizobium sp. ISRA432]
MKMTADRPYAKPEAAARRLLEICREVQPVQDGRLHIEKINYPFLFRDKGSPAEYRAGLDLLVERKILFMHESGTYVRILNGADSLLA